VVLLTHGLQEHAHAFDWIAPELVGSGFHAYALDWRGHGDSQRVGEGGYYHFADYTADLAFLVRRLGGRVALVGHSMGGSACLTYAGTEPDRVAALVLLEGLGPPDSAHDVAPGRFARWIGDLERVHGRSDRPLSLEAASARLRERFPSFSEEVARHMALHGTRATGRGRVWKFDPLHHTRSPQPYYVAQARAFWERVTCPVLYVEGTESFLHAMPLEVEKRVALLRAERVTIACAGHHPHLEQPRATARALIDFLRRTCG
jgi:pimeloyl-ACP methyl ester carboxylesterase